MDKITILSFDPGLTTSGWAFSEYNIPTNTLHVQHAGTLEPSARISNKEHKSDVIRYGARIMTLCMLRSHVRDLVSNFTPNIIVTEDAFYNRFRPTAYCALIQWIITVNMLVNDEFQQPLFKLSPKTVKLAMSGSGKSGKLDMQKAINTNRYIELDETIDLSKFTEHTCDSIGVGYAFTQEILPTLLRIWSITDEQEETYRACTSPVNHK